MMIIIFSLKEYQTHSQLHFSYKEILESLSNFYSNCRRFNNLEKLFSSIFSVIPNALSMLFIMFIFLFIYTSLGIDMFAFIRT
jgi:hypothetical protein